MAGKVAISLKNVSKCYKRYIRPVDRLKEILLPGKSHAQEFWALQDINLEVFKGDTVGIVGQNGSGKSTLLQIIAGTLTPTTGKVQVNGRVSALLELGSGFNPEFTGRQNVFFNGRLLGLSQGEIEAKFDEIVAFADIGDFLNQPVKTYSSGMFVRLAFSVAVNVEPEILIVDEALAVGDIFFQAKCCKKIESLREKGITSLVVSHDTNTIENLCNKSILLHQGIMFCEDTPRVVSNEYYKLFRTAHEDLAQAEPKSVKNSLKSNRELGLVKLFNEHRIGNGRATIHKVYVTNLDDEPKQEFSQGDSIKVTILVEFYNNCYNVVAGFGLRDRYGRVLCGKHSWYDSPGPISSVHQGEIIEFTFILELLVEPAQYLSIVGIATQRSDIDYDSIDIIQDAFAVNIIGKSKHWGSISIPGAIYVSRATIPPNCFSDLN